MTLHYLKTFLRLISKRPLYSLINIMGMSVGLCCCLIIALYVRHELSYDRFFANSADLYRVSLDVMEPGGVERLMAGNFYPVAPLLEQNFPEIEAFARMWARTSLLSHGDTAFFENNFRLVDPEFFRMFSLAWLAGDPSTALANPASVVLTRSAAKKYFGSDDPLGRTLTMSEGIELQVTGVINDLPSNTHLSGSVFAPMALRNALEPGTSTAEWFDGRYNTYMQLSPDTGMASFRQALVSFSRNNISSPSSNILFTLNLDRVTDIHLNPKVGDLKPSGSKLNIAVFSAIGLAILLIACINFVNLITASSTRRKVEVGLRIALGARRSQVLGQFLGESVLFILLAMLLAMGLVEVLLPMVQQWLGLNFELDTLMQKQIALVTLLSGLGLGFLAGWYPSLILSRQKPALTLKKSVQSVVRGMAINNLLVVVQFAIAIVLIISSIVILWQMRFAGDLDQGFQRDGMVIVRTSNVGSSASIQILKDRLLQESSIEAATVSAYTPERYGRVTFVSSETDQTNHRFAYVETDFDYFRVYGLKLLAGRFFRQDMSTDLARPVGGNTAAVNGSFVINERAARELGWSAEQAIGKLISNDNGWYRVVGVVNNTIESARAEIVPAIYVVPADMNLNPRRNLTLRISGNDLAATLGVIDAAWAEINPGEPIVRSFLDDDIRLLYRTQASQMYLALMFAALSIVICCMGLFALASLTAANRTKEVGVRKVSGSSVWQIVLLLTNDFSKLVLVSNIIAWPIAWYGMDSWLKNFAYRIDLTPVVFICGGLIALCIAWVTVASVAAKAAGAKPVLALAYE